MYVQKIFQNNNESEVRAFIRENSFAVLVSQAESHPIATHLPLVLSSDENKLHGHVSRANPQWKSFADQTVLAIFNGPHAYISSSWYDHENVPTWNYIAVHVYGKVRIIEGGELLESLSAMVNKYETQSVNPVSVKKMSPEYLRKQMQAIVGIEIEITSIEAAYKLSQNRDDENHNRIVNELKSRNMTFDSHVAEAMQNMRDSKH